VRPRHRKLEAVLAITAPPTSRPGRRPSGRRARPGPLRAEGGATSGGAARARLRSSDRSTQCPEADIRPHVVTGRDGWEAVRPLAGPVRSLADVGLGLPPDSCR
jgi:hypothetical protein